jgi:hypothetical protein
MITEVLESPPPLCLHAGYLMSPRFLSLPSLLPTPSPFPPTSLPPSLPPSLLSRALSPLPPSSLYLSLSLSLSLSLTHTHTHTHTHKWAARLRLPTRARDIEKRKTHTYRDTAAQRLTCSTRSSSTSFFTHFFLLLVFSQPMTPLVSTVTSKTRCWIACVYSAMKFLISQSSHAPPFALLVALSLPGKVSFSDWMGGMLDMLKAVTCPGLRVLSK